MSEKKTKPPEDAAQPLAGITVVEMGHSVAAPFGGQTLGDLGARVIKIEKPGAGDDARNWGPPFWDGEATVFLSLNRNKFSAEVDMKDAGEFARLKRFLLEETDVVMQNMRPGLAEKLGLGPSLRKENPRLIYCNMGAFGAAGPFSDRPGYDPLMQAFGGIMSITGEEGRPPVRVGPSIIDMATGMWAVIGILAALHRRELTGEGCELDTSLYETTLTWIGTQAAAYLATGNIPKRRGSENSSLAPYRVFEAADGYVLIAAGNNNLFRRLSAALGHAEWADDERYATNPQRVINREALNGMVQDVVATQPAAHWVAVLDKADVPCAPLQTIDQVLAHPQTKALEILQDTPDKDKSFMGLPISFDGKRPPLRRAPPKLGEDSHLVLGGKKNEEEKQ